jgi:hypothetical protein
MPKQHVAAVLVSRYNIMDKTLQDYIDRIVKQQEEEKSNRNQYPVLPEQDETDSKKNPYGNH